MNVDMDNIMISIGYSQKGPLSSCVYLHIIPNALQAFQMLFIFTVHVLNLNNFLNFISNSI